VNVSAVGNDKSMNALLADAQALMHTLLDHNEQDATRPSQANTQKQRLAAD
jgi:hypothetical protein